MVIVCSNRRRFGVILKLLLEASLLIVFIVPFIMTINYDKIHVGNDLHPKLNALELKRINPQKGRQCGHSSGHFGHVDAWFILSKYLA